MEKNKDILAELKNATFKKVPKAEQVVPAPTSYNDL